MAKRQPQTGHKGDTTDGNEAGEPDAGTGKVPVTDGGYDLKRRDVLKLAGASALAAGGFAGLGGAVSTEDYGTVVDVVQDAGADPNGSDPIDDVFEEYVADDTLLVFPDGEYQSGQFFSDSVTNFGMVAADGANPTIRPSAPESDLGEYFLYFKGSDISIEGFTFDFTQDGYGGRVQIISNGDLTMRDVTVEGDYPGESDAFRFDVRDANSTGIVENVHAKGGYGGGSNKGIYVGRQHAGEIYLRNCSMQEFSGNGVYASNPGYSSGNDGAVKIEGGYYANNNISNLRIGSTGSYIKQATVVVDKNPPQEPGDPINSRGIRIRNRDDMLVEDCDVVMEDGGSSGAIVFNTHGGSTTVRNTRVHVDSDSYDAAIYAKSPQDVIGSTDLSFENVQITGGASGVPGATIYDRDGTTFSNCCISLDGDDGIQLNNSSNCAVADCSIDVSGEAVALNGSSADVTNLSKDASCTAADKESETVGADDGSGGSGNEDSNDSGATDAHVLTVAGGGSFATYEFSVSGSVEKSTANGATINDYDSIDGATVTGRTTQEADAYEFTGEVTDFTSDGSVDVTLDGESVDPATLGSSDSSDGSDDSGGSQLPNRIVIDGSIVESSSTYDFSVSGDLAADSEAGDLESDDTIEASSATGSVSTDTDSYRFSGDIDRFLIDGTAKVTFEDTDG